MNQVKKELVPKLRFKEFEKDGDWEEKKLGEIADYENGKAHEQDISDHGKYLVVNSKFISTEGSVRKFTNEGHCLAEKGEILMVLSDVPNGRAIAKCFLIDESNKYTVNQRICRIKPRENVSGFIFCILNRNEFYLNFDDGVKQTNLRREDVLDCPIFLPTKKEQTRISDCLSSIDELIEAQDKKLEALQRHKKGLMQDLFPAEGQTLPRLRFPEFQSSLDWKPKKIGDVDFASLHKGKGISKADISEDGKTPCVRYGELYTRYGEVISEVYSKTNYLTSSLFLSKKNDVIIPASGETKIDIAKASCVTLDNVALSGDLNIIRSNHNGIFISYYLNGTLKKEISKVAQGDSVVHLYLSQLAKLELFLPELEEQNHIADCLSSIDNLITNQTKKLKSLRLHKKGLMQQLFPNISEAQ